MRRYFGTTIAALAAPFCLFATIPPTVEAVDTSLSVLSFNLYFLPIFDSGQSLRAQRIVKAPFVKSHDVVVFQECFESSACNIVVEGLKHEYPYYTNVIGEGGVGSGPSNWDSSTGGSFSLLKFTNGGVRIMSKWPILEKHEHFYAESCGTDAMARKGFAYVKLNVKGSTVHVVGTHAQSTISGCSNPRQIRASQQAEIEKFVTSKRIPANQLLVLAGDFNVDRDAPGNEYQSMLQALNARPADAFKGHTATWDPQTNELAKLDGDKTVQYLDYVLTGKNNMVPKSSIQTALTDKAPAYKIGNAEYYQYSDHFPVVATIVADI
ncbi:hypothetical protein DFQ27_003037 [Actinomortierella ambigua]|uniref:sphingomyelin phosphodiesterase n=1 Tax=Actinomortierella ambigua TaxID=1343610 RepID=A0A9P6QIA3_9FUNG|nr:hypothetical protein DFQ27_003037 [Actinomortierella ambigua]